MKPSKKNNVIGAPYVKVNDQLILLKIKSLLNDLSYLIKDDHKIVIDEYHALCRKYCSLYPPSVLKEDVSYE